MIIQYAVAKYKRQLKPIVVNFCISISVYKTIVTEMRMPTKLVLVQSSTVVKVIEIKGTL